MVDFTFSREQLQVIQPPLSTRLFIQGPAGSGKTTAGVARLLSLVSAGVPGDQILVLVPQRTLAFPYYRVIDQPDFAAGGRPTVVTLGGLGQRMIDLFWPSIYRSMGFGKKNQPPAFLTLETAQYYLALLVQPLLDQGYFQSIKLDRSRLLSQIIDNLNKAAAIGIDHTAVGELLKAAWVGEPAQQHVYEEAQHCADLFRQFCLQNNLLDFSLQLEGFTRHLWQSFLCREYLTGAYRHLIFDNVEEDVPVAHDIVRQWLPSFDSALLIYDSDGGYRSFLGADPQSGAGLQDGCEENISFTNTYNNSPAMETFRATLDTRIKDVKILEIDPAISHAVEYVSSQYLPEMVGAISARVSQLVNNHRVPPGEIAILAPFLSDSLRFTLMGSLEKAAIPSRTHRPSRSLREEPATLCLLTLAKLAHPEWGLVCSHYDVRTALMQSIAGLDLVRADLLAQIVFRPKKIMEGMSSFDRIQPSQQERISFLIGEKFEKLRIWVAEYRLHPVAELDIFLSRLFGEILSQPGFGFHENFNSATVAARLIESVRKFRWATRSPSHPADSAFGLEYIRMVDQGVIAAQFLPGWELQGTDAVFIAPAFTFLMANQAVDNQFWLDLGSQGWWERLYQPLTHPYVLTRHWQAGRPWTDADEVAANRATLAKLTTGLIRRCRKGIILCTNRMNEQGDEQRGILLQSIQSILRRLPLQPEGENV
jgi:hypothetical protein